MPSLDDLSRDELIALVRSQADRIAELAAANETLAAKVAKLEHLFSRNSDNSSNPPSQDQGPGKTPPAKPRREPRRGKGKQKGAPGSRLAWREQPDDQRDRFPEGLCSCGQDLGDAADLGVVDRYQETEIPQPRAVVTQYDQHAVACGCGKVHTATRPEGARPHGQVGYGPNLQAWAVYLMVVGHVPTHRCVQVLAALTGAEPSPGFVHGLLTRVATALTQVDARIRTLITLVRVLCMDETPIRVGPKMPRPGRKKADRYLLIACTELYTHFLLGDRDLDTFRASVLCDLTAGTVVVHDRYQLYDNTEFRHVAHQLCCAHLLRDLQGAAEVYPDELWPTQIADALRGLIHATNTARDNGHPTIEAATRDRLLHTLRHGVLTGLSATTTRGNRPGEHKARLLLETFRDRHHDILRFVTDLTVPPTSNDAERGLRPSKVQQNVSGRLTSVARTQDRYRILGYAATAAKHGHDKLTVIRDAVVALPWMPELPRPHLTVRM